MSRHSEYVCDMCFYALRNINITDQKCVKKEHTNMENSSAITRASNIPEVDANELQP